MQTLERLSEVERYEQERGKPAPSLNHGIVQGALVVALHRYSDRFTTVVELTLHLGGQTMVPDLCVYPKLSPDWIHDTVRVTEPPLLAIEILSPTQGMQELVEKAESYLRAGVQACWLVQPSLKAVVVFLPGQEPHVHTTGSVIDETTGIEVALADVFAV